MIPTSIPRWTLPVCLLLAGCASALREPPAFPSPDGRAAGASATQVDRLLAEADRLYRQNGLASVRRAAETWLAAAGADRARIDGWVGAIRARVWLAGHEPGPDRRREAAVSAVHAAQWCERARPDATECAYWLAVALGVQAREKSSTALDAIPIIVERLEQVARDDPRIDRAGPHRVLALVYLRAPGWPTGPGDADTGLEHARRAVELAPDFPPNQLCLGEALAATGDPVGAQRAYDRAAEQARGRVAAGDLEAREWLREAQRLSAQGRSR